MVKTSIINARSSPCATAGSQVAQPDRKSSISSSHAWIIIMQNITFQDRFDIVHHAKLCNKRGSFAQKLSDSSLGRELRVGWSARLERIGLSFESLRCDTSGGDRRLMVYSPEPHLIPGYQRRWKCSPIVD